MRPIYETQADRGREAGVAAYLEHKYNCRYAPTEGLSVVDGALYKPDGTLVALVEIKNRNNASTRYPTYMLSARKWRDGMVMATEKSATFLLVVKFTDGIYATKLKTEYPTEMGGRYDRNDSKDLEQCIYIPMSDFREI